VVKVLQADRARADADGLCQCGAAGLVAHVGTVGQVVGAEPADEQLVCERGLVGGPAGGVENGLVRAVQPAQLLLMTPKASSQLTVR
jgi:hypothetical protein